MAWLKDIQSAWSNLTESLNCAAPPRVAGESEVAINSAVDDDDEGELTFDLFVRRFVTEACSLKDLTPSSTSAEEIAGTLLKWSRRLEKGKISKTGEAAADSEPVDVLEVLLSSRALEIAVTALTRLDGGRATLRSAACPNPPEAGGGVSASDEAGGALRRILTLASPAPVALLSQLLQILAEAAEKVPQKQRLGDSAGEAAVTEDLQWIILLVNASVTDVSELPICKSNVEKRAFESALATVEALTASAIRYAQVSETEIAEDTPVWAEWPANGQWYHAVVASVTDVDAQVHWVQREGDAKNDREDDYLIAIVGEFYDYTQPTTLPRTAVVPSDQERPAPATAPDEQAWTEHLESAEKLTLNFNELKKLCDQLHSSPKSPPPSVKKFEENASATATKALTATSNALSALRRDNERRAEKLQETDRRRVLIQAATASREAEQLLGARTQQALEMVGGRANLIASWPAVADTCLRSEQMRGRQLEELLAGMHAAIYGEEAYDIARDPARLQGLRVFNSKASKLVDLAWREMVQLAAETLGDDGSLHANSADMSRAAKRYREMRQECVKNMERLQKLEQDPPKQRATVGKKVAKAAAPKVTAKAKPAANQTKKDMPAKPVEGAKASSSVVAAKAGAPTASKEGAPADAAGPPVAGSAATGSSSAQTTTAARDTPQDKEMAKASSKAAQAPAAVAAVAAAMLPAVAAAVAAKGEAKAAAVDEKPAGNTTGALAAPTTDGGATSDVKTGTDTDRTPLGKEMAAASVEDRVPPTGATTAVEPKAAPVVPDNTAVAAAAAKQLVTAATSKAIANILAADKAKMIASQTNSATAGSVDAAAVS